MIQELDNTTANYEPSTVESWPALSSKLSAVACDIALMDARHAATIKASITAYSTAVGPLSSAKKRRIKDFMTNTN